MLQSTRLRAARSLAARNRAFFTCARNAIGSGPAAGADPCAPARDASAATANAAMASSNVRIFDMVPPARAITPLTVLRACGEYSRTACSVVGLGGGKEAAVKTWVGSDPMVGSSNHLVGPHHLVLLVLEDVSVNGISERLVAPDGRSRRESEFD